MSAPREPGGDSGPRPRSVGKGLLRLALVALAALVLGLIFAAYQHPALLLDFGSLLLMCG
ncbi:MAG: hypothetical protein AB7S63_08530 [Thauera sp.]|jgi:hypothetical protein